MRRGGHFPDMGFAAVAFFLAPPALQPCRLSRTFGSLEFWGYELCAMYKQHRPRPKTPKDLTPQAASLPLPPSQGCRCLGIDMCRSTKKFTSPKKRVGVAE